MKKFWQSKTVWLNAVAALLMILDLLSKQPFLPQSDVPYVVFIIAVINVILRVYFTDTGIASAGMRAKSNTS